MKKILRILAVTMVLSLWCIPGVQATTVTLSDLNSTATIDTASQAGMYNWTVDGVSMMYQQWFWYRIGTAGPESSIDTISAAAIVQTDPTFAKLTYTNRELSIQVGYFMSGGNVGTNTSDIAETIRVNNLSATALNLYFFQYSDFDLGGSDNDTVNVVNGSRVQQFDPNYGLTESVVTPPANWLEANFYANTINSLNDGGPTTLNNNKGPLGPGDATWAYEWYVTIPVGGTFIISKDKNIRPLSPVPEPGTLLLLGLGLVGLGIARKKK
jgi:PEP-CTERM motif